jgi:TfoX/Sxy family transcriptional regulator of competence genes
VTAARDYATHIVERLEAFGLRGARRVFGGHGIVRHGQMSAPIADGNPYLKANAEFRERFVDEGGDAFRTCRKDRKYRPGDCLAPETFFDDEARPDRSRVAFDAARRNPVRQKNGKS